MRLPFGYRIVKQTRDETHVHITFTVDPKVMAAQIRDEMQRQARRNANFVRGSTGDPNAGGGAQ